MFEQSRPHPEMIDLIRELKRRYRLKIVAVSNEGRELTLHRVKTFQLSDFIDFFVSSCFVHMRKPDEDMYRMALDGSQVPAAEALYIDDRPMFVDVAAAMGIRGIRHTGDRATRAALAEFGLAP
jgi:putative hydrolase of the HAD superfamily